MTEPLGLFGSFSGSFKCGSAGTLNFMSRDLGSGENWYSLDLPVGVNVIMMEADPFTAGRVTIDVGPIDGSEPARKLTEASDLSVEQWQVSKTVAVTTPSRIRMSLNGAGTSDVGKRIAVFVTVIEPS